MSAAEEQLRGTDSCRRVGGSNTSIRNGPMAPSGNRAPEAVPSADLGRHLKTCSDMRDVGMHCSWKLWRGKFGLIVLMLLCASLLLRCWAPWEAPINMQLLLFLSTKASSKQLGVPITLSGP